MTVDSTTPDLAYLTKGNIVHPLSEGKGAQQLLEVTAAEARARAEQSTRYGTTVTGGAIQRHR